ncbi:hypothetical protein [Streptomyces sp. PR69]|uniref:hypothetical protein n=1 Tax=Streptomyces sp. PR69 TaxID=2984950 RepID=UPI002263B268|nr:hypothetical protein [Streptomyces sp. PR69]
MHRYAPVATAAESTTEAAVIAGLVQGLTDESVALRIGVTPRTVRRQQIAHDDRHGDGGVGGVVFNDVAGVPPETLSKCCRSW